MTNSQSPQTELAALVSEASIEHIAEDIACAVMDPRPDVVAMRHSAMIRLGDRLRNPLPRDIEFALASRPSPLVDTGEALREARELLAMVPAQELPVQRHLDAIAKIDAALAAHPKPEVPRAASASDIAELLDDPGIKAAVRVPGECPDCLRKADRCTCPKPEESN